ncbi:MAG: hypothetical protein HY518_02350 [Candidatus Aenigmarchaeota archaeon]|nr:hypothetical protein [Candidatus Aenigmarchaeota archaeon]
MYREFRQANPTFEKRIEALTSGLLSRDLKALTLWSMGDEKYSIMDLYHCVGAFCGVPLPVTNGSVWNYAQETLESSGFVAPDGSAYVKTDAGFELGDPIAARALRFVNDVSRGRKRPKYCSMTRIFGNATKTGGAEHTRGYGVYRVLELLGRHPDRVFRREDVMDLTGLSESTASGTLNDLGAAGIVDYESPHSFSKGKRNTGWAAYSVSNREGLRDADRLYEGALRIRPMLRRRREGFLDFVDFTRKNADRGHNCHSVGKGLGISVMHASTLLSVMEEMGYLTAKFKGRDTLSRLRSNEYGRHLWSLVLRPVGRIADTIGPYRGLYSVQRRYERNEEMLFSHVENDIAIYELERRNFSQEAGDEIRSAIARSLGRRRGMRPCHIAERVRSLSGRDITDNLVEYHLQTMIREKAVRKAGGRKYRLA